MCTHVGSEEDRPGGTGVEGRAARGRGAEGPSVEQAGGSGAARGLFA